MGFFTKELDEAEETPIGMTDFNQWSDEVVELAGLPLNDSMRFAVATIVLENKEILTKKEASLKLKKAAQNQLAAFVFQNLKSKRMQEDEDARKAEIAAAQAAAVQPETPDPRDAMPEPTPASSPPIIQPQEAQAPELPIKDAPPVETGTPEKV